LAGDVAAIDLDGRGRIGGDAGHPRPQQDAVAPVADAGDDQQASPAGQSARNEVAPGGVRAAPGARVHPVVDPLVAVRANVLEVIVAPALLPAAPGAVGHRVLHAAAATPVAARVILESLRRLQRLRAGIGIGDVPAAPGAERELVRHHPAAVAALRAGDALGVAPLEPATAVGAAGPERLELGAARRAADLGPGYFATQAGTHRAPGVIAPAPRPRCAG